MTGKSLHFLMLMTALLTLSAPALAQEAEAEPPPAEPPQAEQPGMNAAGMTGARPLDDARAREHFRIATSYYEEGRFSEAGAQFTEAFQLSARAELLYNAYVAYRDGGDSARAAASLESYLEQIPNAPDRENLLARLEELRRNLEDDAEQAAALAAARQEAAEARATAEEEARARREAEGAGEAWPWVIFAVGAAAAVAGAVTGGLALSDASALRSECDDAGLCNLTQAELDDRRADATLLANITDALLIGGGVVAATGLILALVFGLPSSGEAEEESSEPQVDLSCGLQGCRATLTGSF